MAKRENWSRPRLNDYVNDPELCQIELPANNMSHRFEAPR
jgi:HNH/ENDO VII superfamily nuclease with conserved GHE residues